MKKGILAILICWLALLSPAWAAPGGEDGSYDQLLREIVNLRLDIEQQRREIRSLREEVGQLRAQLEGKPYRKSAPASHADAAEPPSNRYAEENVKPANPEAATKKPADAEKPDSSPKTHKVAPKETLSAIARQHDISLSALEKANPGVNAKTLKPGTVLALP